MLARLGRARKGNAGCCLALLVMAAAMLHAPQAAADAFTQRFDGPADLVNKSLRLSPDGTSDYFDACTVEALALPFSTGNATLVSLQPDGFSLIEPGFSIEFFGAAYSKIFLGANGYITFGLGDIASAPLPANHFNLPRISPYFADLDPTLDGEVSWEVIGTQLVITYKDVPLKDNFTAKVSFQVQIFSSGGVIITWTKLPSGNALVGVSQGNGVPGGFTDSDLSAYATCGSDCLTAVISCANELATLYAAPPLSEDPAGLDFDVNGIPDVLNLRLLEQAIRRGDAFGHCPALAAWENNLKILETKLAVIPDSFFVGFTRGQLLRACAGMATVGDGRFPQNLVRLLGYRNSLNIGRTELDESAEPYLSWSGDFDRDNACNLGEFEAAINDEAFLAAAFDANQADSSGQCYDDFFSFPDEEGESTEGQQNTEGEDGDILCSIPLTSAQVVPPSSSPYSGTAQFIVSGDAIVVTVTHTVPGEPEVVLYRGGPTAQGVAFLSIGSGPSPRFSLIAKETYELITLDDYFIQVIQQTPLGANGVIRGAITCVDREGETEEGQQEGVGEGQSEGEGGFEGEPEGSTEGEIIVFEGEPEPFDVCTANLTGAAAIPPNSSTAGGVMSVTNLATTTQVVIFHTLQNPLAGSIHYAALGQNGPKLMDLPSLASPIVFSLPRSALSQLSRGAYVRIAFGGNDPGEIRGYLDCVDNSDNEEGENIRQIHSADFDQKDSIISLREMLRLIQLYNLVTFGCSDAETGFDFTSEETDCRPADFDYDPQNWRMELSELLRIVQFYNAGGYEPDDTTEDGFRPFAF